ncbi:hypothetical protein M5D96_007435 [Drosophila gunungcola]|uniref:Uncharacterized protein n=1 Tax=Drosophila gunungcola TaxID=103775 RepID=A0A9Q0BQC5_9MUSC|nr:hypothetical protein M5D96_007435 [Drosophila gunungcola]
MGYLCLLLFVRNQVTTSSDKHRIVKLLSSIIHPVVISLTLLFYSVIFVISVPYCRNFRCCQVCRHIQCRFEYKRYIAVEK